MTRPDELETLLDEVGLVGDVGHTVLVVTGTTADAVLTILGAPVAPVPSGRIDHDSGSAWAVAHVAGGVLAVEESGFADPPAEIVARLSHGGSAALARGGGEARERFACARDGVVVWDATDWDMIEADERDEVPAELRPAFDTAWCDLSAADDENDPDIDPFAAAVAMAEVFTGISVVWADLAGLVDGEDWHPVPYAD